MSELVPVEVWPFVVTRNPVLDWRAIYAPEFLLAAHDDYRLVTATAGGHPEPGRVAQSRDLILAFASRPSSDILGPARGRDRFGRLVHVIEGVVTRSSIALELHHLTLIRVAEAGRIDVLVADFWDQTDEGVPPVPSTPHVI